MPINFPDMDSLVFAAKSWRFREPEQGETEAAFRDALADFVQPKDPVESHEIRTGKGWDQWSQEKGFDAIVVSAGKDDGPAPADRAACLSWAKRRAHRLVGLGALPIRSMLNDLARHPELQRSVRIGSMIASTVDVSREDQVRRWIDGFN